MGCLLDGGAYGQSWAVIAGGGDPARAREGMENLDRMLVDRQAGIIRLFTPSFDKTVHDPGYIKGYVPGIRENGGQYTHAAVWTVMAFARMGDAARADELFRMINPVARSDSRVEVQRYRVEPYVMAADIYGEAPHTGKGGWTWYTGAAGWYYRVGLEEILGSTCAPACCVCARASRPRGRATRSRCGMAVPGTTSSCATRTVPPAARWPSSTTACR